MVNRLLARVNRLKRLRKGLELDFIDEHPVLDKNTFGNDNVVGLWNEPIAFQKHLRKVQRGKQPRIKGKFARFHLTIKHL